MLEDKKGKEYKEFQKFMKSIRHNINDSISEQQAIEMLAQHLITKPIFEALFETYSFVNNNPVSQAMESILEILDKQGLLKEQEKLEAFYESVRVRAEGIDNLKAKQDIIIQLYEKFFEVGFKSTTDRLGIVFTPTKLVDFIIYSVEDVLKKHFGKSISDEGVHVLDPFTGTGTFIVRLLQSGLIKKEDLLRKYTKELHANEIILLSYYIAAINIEETFHAIYQGDYIPFEGIILTDTFESFEKQTSFKDDFFGDNDKRLKRQIESPIKVIIGNPPYSIGQTSANDNNRNVDYPLLNQKIDETYARYTSGLNKKSLFDAYIKAFRWATDRVGDTGVIAFITPNSIIDKPSHEGFRKVIHDEFSHIYSVNLKGAVRGKIGEEAKLEGQSVFNILTGISITILVKDSSKDHNIFYYDIGDYLNREDKLDKLSDLKSISNVVFDKITPDKNSDWINQRDERYSTFHEMDGNVFNSKAIGVTTNRDAWVYNYSKEEVELTSTIMIQNYNSEVKRLSAVKDLKKKQEMINTADNFVKWSRGLKQKLVQNQLIEHNSKAIISSAYRPFTKKWLYYDKNIVEYPGIYHSIFGEENKVIYVSGGGARRDFSVLMVDSIPNLHLMENGRGYVLHINDGNVLFSNNSNINEDFCEKIQLNTEDVFYYVYGLLHSKEYRRKYNNDLRKASPRIPVLKRKKEFVKIGRALAKLHLNYEEIPVYDDIFITKKENPSYRVTKMKHPKRNKRDTIIFNEDITISNIPEKAYEYMVNGRSAIEWIMNQYQVKIDKKSGIKDDPNGYSNEEMYIFNLLLRVINVSIQTIDLVNNLPLLELDE